MELTTAEEVHDALRGEVTIRRVKRHYHEKNYAYPYSVTPEALDVARHGRRINSVSSLVLTV